MILNLVMIKDDLGKLTYFGVNDKYYDGMLACGGSKLEDKYKWEYLGNIEISEEILIEEGYLKNEQGK